MQQTRDDASVCERECEGGTTKGEVALTGGRSLKGTDASRGIARAPAFSLSVDSCPIDGDDRVVLTGDYGGKKLHTIVPCSTSRECR